MGTVRTYAYYFKDISFEESPFNDVDNVVFCSLIYLDWKNIAEKSITLKDAAIKYFSTHTKMKKTPFTFWRSQELLKEIYQSKRYGNIILSHYEKIVDQNGQFGAIKFNLDKDTTFIAYEGTDDTIIGWKEDFEMCYKFPVSSQKMAIEYINRVIEWKDKKIIVGGHSKGGNLAMIASMYAKPHIKRKIIKVYNNDGPGFRKQQFESKEYKKMKEKLKMFVPKHCVIGFLLRNPEQYTVVESDSFGIFQHDEGNWQCYGPFFIKTELAKESEKLEKNITKWLDEHDDEQREKFVETLFDILKRSEIYLFSELRQLKLSRLIRLIKASQSLDKETKDLLSSALKILSFEK